MSLSFLTSSTHLNPGSDLWVLPEVEESPYVMKVDWHINFQISAALRHKSNKLSQQLDKTLKVTELETPKWSAQLDHPILLSTQSHLPNRWVLYQMGSQSSDYWLKKTRQHWLSLRKPSIRFFLPRSISKNQFENFIQAYPFDAEVTAVSVEGL